ncbi:MAG: MarR family winged helix-turn-helix transcriptional regulator [Porcipelethomonas sp.]
MNENLMDEFFAQLRRAYYASPEINYSGFLQGEMKILNYLFSHNEPVLPGKLCDVLYMTSARMSAALKSLNAKGYIERRVSESDKRKIPVMLTENGYSYFKEEKEKLYAGYKEMFSKLGEEDTGEFIRILKKLNDIAAEKESELG